MAYDKVVDSAVLDAAITRIADMLREKYNTDAKIAFPSDDFDALIEWLIFPSGTLDITASGVYDVTNYQRANVSISGGGLPSGFSALATDTVTFASGTYSPSITHGLGVAPNFFCVFVEGDISISNNSGYMVGHIARKQPFEGNAGYYTTISITSAGINSMSGNVIKEADVDNYFGAETFMPYGFFKGGLTYRWICGVVD